MKSIFQDFVNSTIIPINSCSSPQNNEKMSRKETMTDFEFSVTLAWVSAIVCFVAGGLFVLEGYYYSLQGRQGLLWSSDFFNATIYLFCCGLLLCMSSIHVIIDIFCSREFNRYLVLFLLTKALVIEIGLVYGLSHVAEGLNKDMSVTLRHRLILSSKEQHFQRKEITQAWDHLQIKYDCCGVDDANDWSAANVSYPDSCCGGREAECGGCLVPLTHEIHDSIVNLRLLAVNLGLVILVCTVGITSSLSCFMCNYKRRSYEHI